MNYTLLLHQWHSVKDGMEMKVTVSLERELLETQQNIFLGKIIILTKLKEQTSVSTLICFQLIVQSNKIIQKKPNYKPVTVTT